MNNALLYSVLVLMTIIGAFASFFLKKASFEPKLLGIARSPWLYLGAVMYISTAVINIWLLYYLPFSTVLPLTSITYIWTMLISYFLLKEKISIKKIWGICLIIIGIFLIALA